MSEIRQRKGGNPFDSLKELDAFKMNKLPEEIEQKSEIGKSLKVLTKKNKLFPFFFFRRYNVNSISLTNNPSNL